MEYVRTRRDENKKARESLNDGDVNDTDISTMIFEIFSSRKKFNYDFKNLLNLYMSYYAPMIKFCRCKYFNY